MRKEIIGPFLFRFLSVQLTTVKAFLFQSSIPATRYSSSTNISILPHHGNTSLAEYRAAMETDDGVILEPIDILSSTITVSSETTATSNELALNDTPLSSIHDSKDIFSLSSKGKGSQKPPLRFEKPFLAAHSGKAHPHSNV